MAEQRLVHIVDDVPELAGSDAAGAGPVLVITLDGFLDAGNASALAVSQLLAEDSGRVVASFDVDELHDYRARRPALTFHEDRYTDYEAPRLSVRLLRDSRGVPFLLLHGPEPDIRWEAFARGVRQVVEAFNVRMQVSLGSIPMAVPHTRPVQYTTHATASRLVTKPNVWNGEIRVPSSAQSLLSLRMGEWGHDAMGFVAHIPHYVAQVDYPEAAIVLLDAVGEATGLVWDSTALADAAVVRRAEISAQVEDSAEVREVVLGLEQQYDAFQAGQNESLLASDQPLPTGDEIGAQIEQFLADLDTPTDD